MCGANTSIRAPSLTHHRWSKRDMDIETRFRPANLNAHLHAAGMMRWYDLLAMTVDVTADA